MTLSELFCYVPAGELYVRPPNVMVATAVQRCARGDWEEPDHMWADHLTWLSVYNKMDYARLHGTTLHMKAIWVRLPHTRIHWLQFCRNNACS